MKFFLILSFSFIVHNAFLLCDNVRISEEIDYEEYSDNFVSDKNYDDSSFYVNNKVDKRNMTDTRLNCFGLGRTFTSILEKIFKKKANGTKALRVSFYLTSKRNPERLALYHGDRFSLAGADFDIRRRTIFIVHGYFADANEKWIADMEKALLQWDDINLFVVEWKNSWNYFKAATNTKTVGDQIATFIGQLIHHTAQTENSDPNYWGPLHLIGHSLGAHICGRVSYLLKLRQSVWPVWRITGLDPAHPCFRNIDLTLQLDRGDAEFVDVIHTNGRMLKKLGLGFPDPLGHVDFYPNGGGIQPGCILTKSSIWKYLPVPVEKIKKIICSHGRSQTYFTESIIADIAKNCTFWAYKWDKSYNGISELITTDCKKDNNRSCIEMGINAENYNDEGIYFAVTGRSFPYCSVDEKSVNEIMKHIERKEEHIFDLG